ncbi:MAG: DUF2341 domain-containing protein, partial [Candidatus Thermoplasmatota archaeon]
MKNKKSIYTKANSFAIVMLFVLGAFVPVNGFIIDSKNLSPESEDATRPLTSPFGDTDSEGFNIAAQEQKPVSPFNTSDPWWNDSWMFRKEITIDHTKIATDLSEFPVLISLTSDADLAAKAQADGDDLVFTDKTMNTLNHEIELYNSSTGQLVTWVNVTSLSSSVNTTLYLYYGNSSCENQQKPPGVWDSDYIAVWHLNEDPGTAGTGGIKDSTVYANHGTDMGS